MCVGAVYIAGVLSGSLATSLTDPGVYLAGASGGVYALLVCVTSTPSPAHKSYTILS